MKKIIFCTTLFAGFCFASNAQNEVRTYYFKGNFQEETQSSPVLTPICNGAFVNTYLPDYTISRQAYKFEENCGFVYDDSLENFISSGSYSIALYFKLSELNSWKRVIDFKSRTSDRGCYVYYGQLNFYNIVTSSGEAPFYTDSFSHYVITRDATTKKVEMYGNGNKFISFIDQDDDAVYDVSKKLRFFQDDLVVPNEASAGTIALLKLYNYAMDSTTVKSEYDHLGEQISSINNRKETDVISIYPNPSNSILHISLAQNQPNFQYQLFDLQGKMVLNGTLNHSKNKIIIESLSNGFYFLHIQGNGNSTVKKVVKN